MVMKDLFIMAREPGKVDDKNSQQVKIDDLTSSNSILIHFQAPDKSNLSHDAKIFKKC